MTANTTQDLLDARQAVLDAGRSSLTANLMVRTVRLLCGFAIKLGYLDRLRATFASLHAEFRTPITEIQGVLGYRCIQTTMI